MDPLITSPSNFKSFYFPRSTTSFNNGFNYQNSVRNENFLISPMSKEVKLQNKVLIKDDIVSDNMNRRGSIETIGEISGQVSNPTSKKKFNRRLTLDLSLVNPANPITAIQGLLSSTNMDCNNQSNIIEENYRPMTTLTITESDQSLNPWENNPLTTKSLFNLDKICPETTTNRWMRSLTGVPATSPIKASLSISPKSAFIMANRYNNKE
jgi:hypothetical protein